MARIASLSEVEVEDDGAELRRLRTEAVVEEEEARIRRVRGVRRNAQVEK
jgi:hypothetical protein